jgi:hypothetical protein
MICCALSALTITWIFGIPIASPRINTFFPRHKLASISLRRDPEAIIGAPPRRTRGTCASAHTDPDTDNLDCQLELVPIRDIDDLDCQLELVPIRDIDDLDCQLELVPIRDIDDLDCKLELVPILDTVQSSF